MMWSLTVLIIALAIIEDQALDIDYVDKDARLLLRLSGLAYASDPRVCLHNIMPAEEQWMVERSKEVPCNAEGNVCSVVVMISAVKKQIIVSFRAEFSEKHLNQEIQQWMGPNVNFYKYGSVGENFVYALNKTWPTVEPILRSPSIADYKVAFTGYSLGGSVATLSSMMTFILKLRRPEQIRTITFGEARMGDNEFAKFYDNIIQNSYRVVHKADIVPHLVACQAGAHDKICESNAGIRRIQHASEVWYDNEMTPNSGFVICFNQDEDPHCSISLNGAYNMNDHTHYFGVPVVQYGLENCETDYNAAPYSAILSTSLLFLVAIAALY